MPVTVPEPTMPWPGSSTRLRLSPCPGRAGNGFNRYECTLRQSGEHPARSCADSAVESQFDPWDRLRINPQTRIRNSHLDSFLQERVHKVQNRKTLVWVDLWPLMAPLPVSKYSAFPTILPTLIHTRSNDFILDTTPPRLRRRPPGLAQAEAFARRKACAHFSGNLWNCRDNCLDNQQLRRVSRRIGAP